MKTEFLITGLTLLALTTLNSQLSTAFAQGSLTPPGAPAPMMKSLDQIEPRTPIVSLPFIITNSGSYYLTVSLSSGAGGITVLTNHVTIDLRGFSLTAPIGILVPGAVTNLVLCNGIICNCTFNGISATNGYTQNLRLESLHIANCGGYGAYILRTAMVRNCAFVGNGVSGLYLSGGLVSGCLAKATGWMASRLRAACLL